MRDGAKLECKISDVVYGNIMVIVSRYTVQGAVGINKGN